MIQIYTGNGKGKTTAAFGLAMRASGHGIRVFIGQFLKGQRYGEVLALEGHPLIDVEQFGTEVCITRENVSQEDYNRAKAGLDRCAAAMDGGRYRLVVLDEVCVAIAFGLLNEGDVMAVLDRIPDGVELVLTGRYASARLMERADLVTEMREVKHYYAQGIGVR
ncbi:MAG: cob(I)yrinic acid a,c-diamide adenosyltransferase, partial [Opitutales bacterium]|nr:cob(I)yrinic acid a,c-diamide adenosyltransferase [Opitutales bacterium]